MNGRSFALFLIHSFYACTVIHLLSDSCGGPATLTGVENGIPRTQLYFKALAMVLDLFQSEVQSLVLPTHICTTMRFNY